MRSGERLYERIIDSDGTIFVVVSLYNDKSPVESAIEQATVP